MRLRLAAAEAAELSGRALHLPRELLWILRHGVAALRGRELPPRHDSMLDDWRWPRSEKLLIAFGRCLTEVLPDGVTVTPPRGRSFFLSAKRELVSPDLWPEPEEGGQVIGMIRSWGFGFSPISGRADMPQSRPDDLARALAPLLKDITESMQRRQPGWPETGAAELTSKLSADKEAIHMWWEDPDGRSVAQLPHLDLLEAGLTQDRHR